MIIMDDKKIIAILKPGGRFEIDWKGTRSQTDEAKIKVLEDLYNKFKKDEIDGLLYLGLEEKRISISPSFNYLRTIAILFVTKLSKRPDLELVRDRIVIVLKEEEIENLLKKAPYLVGFEYLDSNWIRQIWKNLNNSFCKTIRFHNGTVKEFFSLFNPNLHLIGRVFFHLVENNGNGYPFGFLATYSAYISDDGKEKELPLKNALIEYEEDDQRFLELIATIDKAGKKSQLISNLIKSRKIFDSIGLSEEEAYVFLKEIPLYEESGISCRVPKWWTARKEPLKISLSIGNKIKSRIDFDGILDFEANLYFAEEKIDPIELKKIMLEAEGLRFIKGKWIEVDHKKLDETLRIYEHAKNIINERNMTMVEAMRFQLDVEKSLSISKNICEIEISNGEWINMVIDKLIHPGKIESISCGNGFNGKLRLYQKNGLNWLYFMKNIGLGACLADDMGLGKTVEVIALLNYCKDIKPSKNLIVVPVSLIGNWISEIKKFAPSLKYWTLHSSENKNNYFEKDVFYEDYDVYITSYGMLQNYGWLKEIKWDSVILDEAQAIKNPRTKRTKAVKQLKSDYRIAMTGTPIENKLSDLWSIFDFINKGLLGTSKEFLDFIKNLEKNKDDYSKLKKVVNPFILRRLKTDKNIISDLPEKIEMKSYSNLSRKQTILYNKLVSELKVEIESSKIGIKRKGIVLSAIIKFKQICNHPDQYLGQNIYLEKDSGKFKRLREICESIYEKRERVIVFTQFREITEPLNNFLEGVFNHKGLVLHGGTSLKKRTEYVEKFQGREYVPFMVLSIKAGGVGINLTSANHVIHFDRWWNPAVENQATDRSFRIGQCKNVIVHKLITRGTIEEKIDLMIEDKIKLSEEIISNNQANLITEMDNEDLIKLFTLEL